MKRSSPEIIATHLRRAAALTTLKAETRLDGKLDMSPAGIAKRLKTVSALLRACRRLEARELQSAKPPRAED